MIVSGNYSVIVSTVYLSSMYTLSLELESEYTVYINNGSYPSGDHKKGIR